MSDIFYRVAHRPQEIIDKLKTRYEDFDESLIPDIVEESIGKRPKKVERSTSWGSAHVIYFLEFDDADDLVFRANINLPEPEVEMLIEKLITDLVAEHDIPTNRIVHVDISRDKYDFDFSIQERLGGIDPEDEFEGTEEEYDQFNYETGLMIARMSLIKLEGFGRFNEKIAVEEGKLVGEKENLSDYINVCLDEDLEALVDLDVINSDQSTEIKRYIDDKKNILDIEQGCLVHYDLADHNLRYTDGHLDAIFDWETGVVASPVLDLASCPTWKSHYPKREKLLEGYRSIVELPENFEELEKIFLLRTMIWKMRYAIRAGILNDSHKKKFYDTLEFAGIE